MQARFWHVGDPIPASNVPLFFKVSDQAPAIAAIGSSGFVPSAYVVLPNGEPFIDLVGPYVQWLEQANVRAIVLNDYSPSAVPVSDIVRLCSTICEGLESYAADQVIAACTSLSTLLAILPADKRSLVPPRLDAAAEFVREFAASCLKPLEYGTPFVHMGTSSQHKSWWKVRPSHRSVLARYKSRRAIDFAGHPGALAAVDRWLDTMCSRLDRLHAVPLTPATRQDAIVEASAYCAALAERHLMRSHQGQAVLHLHRALDLLLFGLCDQHGLVVHTQHGGRYAPSFVPPTGSDRITLTSSFAAVKSRLAHHPTRESDFVNVNDWRNLLIHTHYMTGLDDATTRDIFSKIRPHMHALGGSQWLEANVAYLRGVQMTVADLLDVDESLSSTVQRVTY